MTEQIGIRAKSGERLALKGVEATARIAGLLAMTTVVQRYENASGKNLEIAYTFPLPVDAVLLNFAVCIGERRYCGEVVPRRKAEEQYEQAMESGNSAFRLQTVGKGLYSAILGNVLAGEAVRIELEYAEPLAWTGQSIRYRLPTTLAPRYGEPTHLDPWQRPDTRLDAEYSLAVCVELFGELASTTVASPSHEIRLGAEPGKLKVMLASRAAAMDRDFVLEVHAPGLQSLGVTASGLDTHMAMLAFMPPAATSDVARDTLILLDCSGSMAGDSIRHAKEGVQLALGHLTSADRFGVIGFGSKSVALAPELQPANEQTLRQARRFVTALGDMGGTELAYALEAALAYRADRPLDILLLTDGEAWNPGSVIARARDFGVRIFTVGIGAAVAEDTVRLLADQTGGACELVTPNEEMSARIERHFVRMRQPRITDVDINWPATPLWVTRPEHACFAGDSYMLFAGFESAVDGKVAATVKYADGGSTPQTAVHLSTDHALDVTLVRVAAASYLPSLSDAARQEWAIRFQLITDDTDYLVILARSADQRPEALPELHVVPHMLAAGWGGTGTVIRSARIPVADASAMTMAVGEPPPSYEDVTVFRFSRRRQLPPPPKFEDTAIGKFITRLRRRADRRILNGLPLSRNDLVKMNLPPRLQTVLDEAIAAGKSEVPVILALYAAFRKHEYGELLGLRFAEAVDQLLATFQPDRDLQEGFTDQLDEIKARYLAANDLSLPAFLRAQFD